MFLTLIFLVELVAAIVGFVFRHEIKNSFKNNYEKALKQYNSTGDYRSHAVDKIQSTLHCCGVTDYRDWTDTNYYSEKGFPKSCCKREDCTPQRDADKVNNEGCFIKGDDHYRVRNGSRCRNFLWSCLLPTDWNLSRLLPLSCHNK